MITYTISKKYWPLRSQALGLKSIINALQEKQKKAASASQTPKNRAAHTVVQAPGLPGLSWKELFDLADFVTSERYILERYVLDDDNPREARSWVGGLIVEAHEFDRDEEMAAKMQSLLVLAPTPVGVPPESPALEVRPNRPDRFRHNPEEQRFYNAAVRLCGDINTPDNFLSGLMRKPEEQTGFCVTQRDADVAAAVLQWLGSSAGQGWLRGLGYEKITVPAVATPETPA